jgi:ribosomal protein L29
MKITEEIKNLRSLDIEKLEKELYETEKKLLEENLKVKAGKLDNYSLISKSKKKVARISTIINEKMGNE